MNSKRKVFLVPLIAALAAFLTLAGVFSSCKATGTLDDDGGGSPWGKDKLIILSSDNIVLFMNGAQEANLTANLKEGVLDFTTLEWSLAEEGVIELEGAATNATTIKVKGLTLGDAQITARLIPNEGVDPAMFGDNPLEAVCTVRVFDELELSTMPVGTLMLNFDAPPSSGTPVSKQLQASYIPTDLSAFNPIITWQTQGAGIDVSEAEGVFTLTASEVEPNAKIRAKIEVLGNPYYSAWDNFSVIAFDASKLPITGVTITAKPSTIIRTNTENFSLTFTPDMALFNSIVWEVQNSNNQIDSEALTVTGDGVNGAGSGIITAHKNGPFKVIARSQSVNGSPGAVLTQFDVNVTDLTVTVTRTGTGDIVVGGKAQFSAAVNASNQTVTWTVDKTTIAEVSAAGEVTAKIPVSAAAGEVVTVTAKSSADNTTTGSASVKIVPHNFTIKYDKNGATTGINPADKQVTYGQSVTLDTGTGFAKPGYEFKGWTKQGETTVVTNAGASTLVGTSGGNITLYAKWESKINLVINSTTLNIAKLGTATLTVTGDEGGGVTWSSSNSSFAAVSTSGVVTGVAVGQAVITATSNLDTTKTAACTVTIKDSTGQDTPVSGQGSNKDLMIKFGVKTGAYALSSITSDNVKWTFTRVSNYLKGKSASGDIANIALGDYVDLASLSVAAYNSNEVTNTPEYDKTYFAGAISVSNTAIQDHGTLLRIIVVAINPYSGKNGNSSVPHLIFQFQNLPGLINISSTTYAVGDNTDGYLGGKARKYLYPTGENGSGNYYNGLINAGVPLDDGGIVWGLNRIVTGKSHFLEGWMETDTITDKLWLPTEREMFSSTTYSYSAEAANQTHFAYYADNTARIKYINGQQAERYIGASSYNGNSIQFNGVDTSGDTIIVPDPNMTSSFGIAPAFAIKAAQ